MKLTFLQFSGSEDKTVFDPIGSAAMNIGDHCIDGDTYSETERNNGDSNYDLFNHPLGLASPNPT